MILAQKTHYSQGHLGSKPQPVPDPSANVISIQDMAVVDGYSARGVRGGKSQGSAHGGTKDTYCSACGSRRKRSDLLILCQCEP